jgi:hypothetical protein
MRAVAARLLTVLMALICLPPWLTGHGISISRSSLRVEGTVTRLEVRLPLAELDHTAPVNRNLIRHFALNGEPAVSAQCRAVEQEMWCQGTFLTPRPRVVECRLAEAVSPDHVHTMRFEERIAVFTRASPLQQIGPEVPWKPLLLFVCLLGAAGYGIWRLAGSRQVADLRSGQ